MILCLIPQHFAKTPSYEPIDVPEQRCQHVKSTLCEGCRWYLAEFQSVKVVKIFDHLLFFVFIQLKQVAIWKLLNVYWLGMGLVRAW